VEVPPDAAAARRFRPAARQVLPRPASKTSGTSSQPAFEQAIERYHEPVSAAVLQVNGFLRNETSGTSDNWFQIYIDLLGAPNQIQTRSYGRKLLRGHHALAEPRIHDVRHAYLHYLLDPLATRHEEIVMRTHGVVRPCATRPALDQSFKSDYLLLVTESLIKAVEARLDKQPALVNQAMLEGYILTAYFAEQLQAYLKQEQAMRFYYPEMIEAIDLKREDARLSQIEFASQAPVRQAKVVEHPPALPSRKGATRRWRRPNSLPDRDLEAARQLFLKALEETSERPLHAQAYYGLARIAILERNPEMAERLFEKTLESAPEPQVKAWALVYLARLSDAAGERDRAVPALSEALAVEGASPAAHDAARTGRPAKF
jgi:tetratricopeptide (TPR) repeat protein